MSVGVAPSPVSIVWSATFTLETAMSDMARGSSSTARIRAR